MVQVGCTINYGRRCLRKEIEESARVDYPGNVGENDSALPSIPTVRASRSWACGAAGSALPWHGRGRRFDPDQVHQFSQRTENDRHTVVDGCRHRVRGRGQNRTRLQHCPARVFPSLPYLGEREQLDSIHFETVRLFRLPSSLRLVEPVCGNNAPAKSQRIPKCRLRSRRLRSRVDHPGSAGGVLRPRRNEAPTNQRQIAAGFIRIVANDWDGLGGSDVVARHPIFVARN